MNESEFEDEILTDIEEFYDDPLGFIHYAFPWGEKDTLLEDFKGPDRWQREQLERVGQAFRDDPETTIKEAVASGHGIGKSCETAWILIAISAMFCPMKSSLFALSE